MSKAEKGSRLEVGWVVQWLRCDETFVDPDAQRKLVPSHAARIGREFDPDLLGYITVNRRKDGKWYVVDGGHRRQALLDLGWGKQLIPCRAYEDLTQAEEASLFVRLQQGTRPIRTFDAFRVRITAREPVACEVRRVVTTAGLALGEGSESGHIAAVRSLEVVLRSGMRDGALILSQVLKTIVDAWGQEASNFNGKIIEGLGALRLRYLKQLHHESLVERLAKLPGGAAGLIGKAKLLQEIRSMSKIAPCVASTCVDLYNKGRRGGKLEDWWL